MLLVKWEKGRGLSGIMGYRYVKGIFVQANTTALTHIVDVITHFHEVLQSHVHCDHVFTVS